MWSAMGSLPFPTGISRLAGPWARGEATRPPIKRLGSSTIFFKQVEALPSLLMLWEAVPQLDDALGLA